MKLVSVIVMALALISLSMDWYQVYYNQVLMTGNGYTTLAIIINKGFLTGIVSVISLYLSSLFSKREGENSFYKWFDMGIYRAILSIGAILVLYLTVFFELNYQLHERLGFEPAGEMIIGFYNMLFLIALSIYSIRKNNEILSNIVIILSALVLLIYISYYNEQIVAVRNDFLYSTHATLGMYLFHYLVALSAVGLLITLFKQVKKINTLDSEIGIGLLWFTAFIGVFIASAELTHLMVMGGYSADISSLSDSLTRATKIGFPVLWGICSFMLMIMGMRLKMRHLRIISLSLFFITLVKLFVFDIRDVSEGGKIIAFISLGVILLIVSFMYQKLKVLILADEGKKQKTAKDE